MKAAIGVIVGLAVAAMATFVAWRGYQYHEYLGEREKQEARQATAMATMAERHAAIVAKTRDEFSRNRAAILSEMHALERAGKWPEALAAASKQRGVTDPEYLQLALKIRKGVAAAARKKAADAEAAVEKADLARRRKEGVSIGMARDEVLKSSWGKPKQVHTTVTIRGTHEQWVYGDGQYLYFDSGILTAVQVAK